MTLPRKKETSFRRRPAVLAAFVVTLVSTPAARAQDASVAGTGPVSTVAFRAENDVVSGKDGNYSSGMSLSLSHERPGPLNGIWKLFGITPARSISTYEVGQIVVTPSNIKLSVPDPADRPYAGLLYFAVSTEAVDGNEFDGLKLITGVVGPASLAEEAQKTFHKMIGSPIPQGWKYQLNNELILNMVYEHRRRYCVFASERGWGADVIPTAGGMLGNVLIQVQADAQVRLGYNLPDDFGTSLMRGLGNSPFPASAHHGVGHRFGVYVFAGSGGNLVARNLTLDGNTFRASPRVPKKHAFDAHEAGVCLWTSRLEITFSYVVWGREYDAQTAPARFAAATLAVHY